MSHGTVEGSEASGRVKLRSTTVEGEPVSMPRVMEEVFPAVNEVVHEMQSEGPEHIAHAAAANRLLLDFQDSAPLGAAINAETLCQGSFVTSSNGQITYVHEQNRGQTPEHFRSRHGHYPRVERRSSAGSVVVGRNVGSQQGGTGRANGPTGWMEDGDAIAAALASFVHNFVAALIGYFDRPSLPHTEGDWELPNIVLAETRTPDQFHPAASYSFRVAPTPTVTFATTVSSPTDGALALQVWNSNKEDMGVVEVDIEEGRNEIVSSVIRAVPMTRGYFNVNVLDAPRGVTVNSVRTFPPAF